MPMPLPYPLAVCLAGVFCCSLLALHLLWVATLHRRSRPTVVGGVGAFAALRAGRPGFLWGGCWGGAGAGAGWFVSRPAGSLDDTWATVVHRPTARLATVGVCGTVLAVVAGVGFWHRRDSLEVHNIVTASVPDVVEAAAAEVGLVPSPGISWTFRPAAGHATVRVRGLEPVATGELLAALESRLESAPVPAKSAGGRYTAAAAGLLGVTFALFAAYFRMTRTF